MKIVIPGGSGHLGTILKRSFERDGHQVVILSRQVAGGWRFSEIDGADVVINLAGRSVNCRYNDRNRREIMSSRVESTRLVGEAIAAAVRPPRLWLQASTATIYAHRFDAPNDENGILGGDEPNAPDTWRFSIEVARSWERTFDQAHTPLTRKVAMRTAIVMSPEAGGAFDTLLNLVRSGLGGRAGDGRQFVSWVHYRDFVSAIGWLIAHENVSGIVNIASPHPLPNAEFMSALRDAWGIGFGLPASRWMLEAGALAMRTETELILKSRRVIPGRLLEAGFNFDYPTWPEAARDLCARWRAIQSERRRHDRSKLSGLFSHHTRRDRVGRIHAPS
jgi:uncharacterized protein (TIGR01777 family)